MIAARLCLALIALALAPAVASHAQQPGGMLQAKCPDAAEIVAIAQKGGYARVIVRFESPVPPDRITSDPAGIADIKARVAAVQDAIIASHFGSASDAKSGPGFARGISRFEITPGFAVNVTAAELEALATDSRVKSIAPDRVLPPS